MDNNKTQRQTTAKENDFKEQSVVDASMDAHIDLMYVAAEDAFKKQLEEAVSASNAKRASNAQHVTVGLALINKGERMGLMAHINIGNSCIAMLMLNYRTSADLNQVKGTAEILCSLCAGIAGPDRTLNKDYGIPTVYYLNNLGDSKLLEDFDRAFIRAGKECGIHLDPEVVECGLSCVVSAKFKPIDEDREIYQLTFVQPFLLMEPIAEVSLVYHGVVNRKDKMTSFLSTIITKFCSDCYVLASHFNRDDS